MKNILVILLVFCGFQIFAQSTVQGFSYQAVIRNADGKALSNSSIDVDVELYSKELSESLYTETHSIKTDAFGQINLVIGKGVSKEGSLNDIPWERGNIFYKIRLQNNINELDIISEAELMAVPYALHANTAGGLVGEDGEEGTRNIEEGKLWTVVGNEVLPEANLLGTTNRADINIITDNETRIEVSSKGGVTFKENIFVEGAATFEDYVRMVNDLDLSGTLTVQQEGQFEGSITTLEDFTVLGDTYLGDELSVGGDVTFGSSFTVENMKPTILTGTLDVGKATRLASTLEVAGKSVFQDLLIANSMAIFNDNVTVEGKTTMNDELLVQKDVNDGGFVATFVNTNAGNGDGINIKLGKDRTIFTPPSTPQLLSQGQVNDIKNLVSCEFTGNKVNLLGNIVVEGLAADVEMIASLAVGVGNLMIGFLNNQLSLPISLPQLPSVPGIETFNGYSFSLGMPPGVPNVSFSIPGIPDFPGLSFPTPEIVPAIPNIDLSALGIGSIPIYDLSFWGIPSIPFCLNDAPGSDPLNNENEFIRFTDNSNQKMGAIRAVSLTDWSNNYLTPSYLFKLHGAITSAVDKKHARYHFKGELSKAVEDYKNIGVEYSSGNGDYAEWLERIDEEETIAPGDIVGVIGGKISRSTKNAEQMMVVSHSPIVLGNVPPTGQNYRGNNVAFMGQVPVKVMGPVSTGDYIVASTSIPGYGIAKSQEEMTIEDFKFAVGRSWENIETDGPKLVNTVVGIHNGDYSKVLQSMNAKLQATDQRFDALESKVEVLSKILADEHSF